MSLSLKSFSYFAFKIVALLFIASNAQSQTTYLNFGSPEYHLVDRMETKNKKLNDYFISGQQAMSRKEMVDYMSVLKLKSNVGVLTDSKVDAFNINRAIGISGEWYENASGESGFLASKRPVLKYFYRNKSDLYNVETPDFFLALNPVLYLQGGYEMNNGKRLTNTRGVELRGRIAGKIGFYTMLADNQEGVPSYVQNWASEHHGQFPGAHYSILNGNSYDMFLARGYVDFGFAKEHINVTFGYDKNKIGFGIRSLVYSDYTAPSSFLRLRSQFGKFSYENLFLEQVPNNTVLQNTDAVLPRRYAAIHQLNYRAAEWASVGIFESSVLAKSDGIPIGVIVPIIGYQSLAKSVSDNNSNTAWGLQFKLLPSYGLQLYGQTFIQKLNLASIGKGAWNNQYALQLGLKYFDVAKIKNLDGQIEFNAARPFTYQGENGSMAAFAHYNQPMAHPLGNNFYEFIGNLRYQPTPLFTVSGRLIYSMRGKDTGANYFVGNSIFQNANQRSFGDANSYAMFLGKKLNTIYANLNVAYELRANLFLEAGGTYLKTKLDDVAQPKTLFFYAGLRLNISRTQFDFN